MNPDGQRPKQRGRRPPGDAEDDDDLGPVGELGGEAGLQGRIRTNVAERQARIHAEALLTAERTMMGWVRTGIQLMALGFMLSRFELLLAAGRFHTQHPSGLRLTSQLVGAVVIGEGAVVCVVAAIRYLRAHRAIGRGEAATPDLVGPMAITAGIVAMGAIVAALVLNIMSAGRR